VGSYRSFVTPSADHCVPVLLPVETSSVMHGMHPRTRDLVIEGLLRVLFAVSLIWTPDFALQRINAVLYVCGRWLHVVFVVFPCLRSASCLRHSDHRSRQGAL